MRHLPLRAGKGQHSFKGEKAIKKFSPGRGLALAPEVGFEPTTNRLTADRSTTELLWIVCPRLSGVKLAQTLACGK